MSTLSDVRRVYPQITHLGESELLAMAMARYALQRYGFFIRTKANLEVYEAKASDGVSTRTLFVDVLAHHRQNGHAVPSTVTCTIEKKSDAPDGWKPTIIWLQIPEVCGEMIEFEEAGIDVDQLVY